MDRCKADADYKFGEAILDFFFFLVCGGSVHGSHIANNEVQKVVDQDQFGHS